ncbi:s-adenosylmethionine transporter [Moniliophthora roreri MCA 2997]|uniref:S-adenosylmethionine transporter n=2 Tax=Moniliophthora roreri TaxID=221103 RepID=V2X1B2_MONRO|nr:s-adenosylmethionine transporter [Moniliophthora roreri MCA 2997]
MSHDARKPTFLQSLLAGGAAGTAVDLLFFPIDTIKTRLQSSQGFAKAGGFKWVYKGIGSVVVGSAPGAAAFFSTYNFFKQNLPIETSSPFNHMVSATAGEVAACLIRVPTEVVKTRTQTASFGAQHQSSLSALKLTIAHGGFRGLYKGFGITVMREIPFTSLQFPLYEYLKRRLADTLDRPTNQARLYAYEAAVCGSIAGGFAAALTTPLDVLKTRVMLDLQSGGARISIYTRLKTIYRTEGGKALFSGVVPRTMWISAGGAVFLGVYEWVVGGLITSGLGS